METQDEVQPHTAPHLAGTAEIERSAPAFQRVFWSAAWRYRALTFGIPAIALAIAGEYLMRTTPSSTAADPALGTRLIQVAVLLVGIVSWVRDGFSFLRRQRPTVAVAPEASGVMPRQEDGLLAAVRTRPARSSMTAAQVEGSRWTGFSGRYLAARTRLGWRAAAFGLVAALALAAWCCVLVWTNFSNPLAPWIWLAMFAALVLTFAGVRPASESLITHDPSESFSEPPVSSAEWTVILGLLAVASVLRLWNIENIPIGPYIDEADRARVARAINTGGQLEAGPFGFFTTDWWGVPTAYFWLVAQSMRLFGDTLAGARVVHVIAGIATVWYTYRLGRVVWSPRAGLVAAALLAVSDFAIQFSRTAGESTITILTWLVCIYYLYKGLKSLRPLDFVLSGIAGGLTLYGYVSGKLLPVMMVAVAIYLLLRWGLKGFRRYLPGLALLALAAFLTYAPNATFVSAHPDVFTMRYKGTAIFNHGPELTAAYHTDNWGVIVAGQFGLTYSAFDVGTERGPFYPTRQPILPVPWAALWILGGAYVLWRFGDARYAILALWVLGGLAGAALTNETPTMQRVAGMLPALALLPALFLDRVVGGIPPLRRPERAPRFVRAWRLIPEAGVVVLVLAAAAWTLPYYFITYAGEAHYYEFTVAGRYAEKLNPEQDVVWLAGMPSLLGSTGPTVFLANGVPTPELLDASNWLPVFDNNGRNEHFLFFPVDNPVTNAVRQYYPTADVTTIPDARGQPFVTAVQVSAADLDAQRMMTARYSSGDSPIFERQEPRLGTLRPPDSQQTVDPPGWLGYPMHAEWFGGLVAPGYGTYRISLVAPGGGTFAIDGRQFLTVTVGSDQPADAEVVLAKGAHHVTLDGTLTNPKGRIELRWGAGNDTPVPIAREFLWGGAQGALLGDVYQGPNSLQWLTGEASPPADSKLVQERRDSLVSWGNVSAEIQVGNNMFIDWKGVLSFPSEGDYGFDVETNAAASIWVDGNLLGTRGVPLAGSRLPVTAHLASGEHAIEIRFLNNHDNSNISVYLQKPGQARALLSPLDLGRVNAGAWLPSERPDAPAADRNPLYAASGSLPVKVTGVIQAARPWNQARGIAVTKDGRVLVADTGNHRIVVYSPEGKQLDVWQPTGASSHFDLLSDLATFPDGTVLALDAGSGVLHELASSGKEDLQLSNRQLGVLHPSGLATAPDGHIFIADTANSRVLAINRDGSGPVEMKNGSAGHQPPDQPVDVTVGADGAVYAVDLRGRLVRFDKKGEIDLEYGLRVASMQGGDHLATWGDQIAFTNPELNSLNFIDTGSGLVRAPRLDKGGDLGLNVPVGVAVGPDNRLYVLDSGNNRVVILERTR